METIVKDRQVKKYKTYSECWNVIECGFINVTYILPGICLPEIYPKKMTEVPCLAAVSQSYLLMLKENWS